MNSQKKKRTFTLSVLIVVILLLATILYWFSSSSLGVGSSSKNITEQYGDPDQIWYFKDSPKIELWFGSDQGRFIDNSNYTYIYFGEIDYVTMYIFNKEDIVIEMYAGGT